MNWQMDAAIATVVSSVAIVASAIFVVIQLRQAARMLFAVSQDFRNLLNQPLKRRRIVTAIFIARDASDLFKDYIQV